LDVLETIQQENCVIQGPPGTGKSQVLTNILGKSLNQGLSTLVISEKRVALEVLQKKLSKFGLDDFTFVTTSETNASDFLNKSLFSFNNLDSILTISASIIFNFKI
jgi:DNA replication protein DnaC